MRGFTALLLSGLWTVAAVPPALAQSSVNPYKPMVTRPPGVADPAHPAAPGNSVVLPPTTDGVIKPTTPSTMPVIKPTTPTRTPVIPPSGSTGGTVATPR